MIKRWLSYPLTGMIKFYRHFISPMTPATCRYSPTCSEYILEAIQIHGPFKGSWIGLKRILRCHPWGGKGYDPVPKNHPPGKNL